ncbi:MAG TPA: membrane dipeptidase [Bacteroidota bacterium]
MSFPPTATRRWRDFFLPPVSLVRCLLALGIAVSSQFDALAQDIVLGGKVTDERTGTALSGMLVSITTFDGELIDTVSTDAVGNWSSTVHSTGADQSRFPPAEFALGQNYPNPFNPSTKIPFRIGRNAAVRISVYNILGQLMDTRDYSLSPGTYSVEWQGKGSAGVLFYSIETGGVRYVRKMIQMEGGGTYGIGNLAAFAGPIPATLQKSSTQSCWVGVRGFAYEPDSVLVALEGSPRVDLAIGSIHDRAFVIDLHNDVLEKIVGSQFLYDIGVRHATAHTDLPRMRDGGLDAQLFSVWIDPTYNAAQYYALAVKFLDSLSAQVERNSTQIAFATTEDSALALSAKGKIAGVLLLEGGHCIMDDLEKLRYFYARGVRCMTITWNNSTSWAVSAKDTRSATIGLSDFGKQVIRTMDSLGMIIDVSHVGKKTVDDILAIASGPVIASHSGCAALDNHYRNLTDDQIRAIAATGGVIGVVFYPPFLSSSGSVTVETVANHIDHIRNLVGIDYIALGSDFDGIEVTPAGLEDVSRFPALTNVLLRRGYSGEDVRKILGGNFMRVFRTVCK